EISIPVCGPLPTGEYLLVMVDEFSCFPVVKVVRSISAERVIPVVDDVISLPGYPEQRSSDNGHAWKSFLQENNVSYRKITHSGLRQMLRQRLSTN
ncbi:MAG: transposase family protein, partial [Chromatiales bacterium]